MDKKTLVLAILVAQAAGCATTREQLDDPLLPSLTNHQNKPAGNRLFGGSNPDKDVARNVPTSPTSDPMRGSLSPEATTSRGRPEEGSAIKSNLNPTSASATGSSKQALSNALGSDEDSFGDSRSSNRAKSAFRQTNLNDPYEAEKETYSQIRKRLDATGVKQFNLAREESSGLFSFRCIASMRNNPSKVKVFEVEDANELRAMLAVVEQIEIWQNKNR